MSSMYFLLPCYFVLSCLAPSCAVLSCTILSCLVLSHLVLPCYLLCISLPHFCYAALRHSPYHINMTLIPIPVQLDLFLYLFIYSPNCGLFHESFQSLCLFLVLLLPPPTAPVLHQSMGSYLLRYDRRLHIP